MPLIQNRLSLQANTTMENLISGSQFEFAPYPASVEFGITAAAIGVFADISTGQEIISERMEVSTANRFPVIPDDYVVLDMVSAGERIKIRAQNTTGAAIVIFWAVRIMPLAAR